MPGGRCSLCGQARESGAGKRTFVCDACLGLKGGFVETAFRPFVPCRVPTIDLREYEIAAEVRALVPRELCEELVVIPVSRAGTFLIVAMSAPDDQATLAALAKATGLQIEPVIASLEEIRRALAHSER